MMLSLHMHCLFSTTGSNDDTVTNGGNVITPWGGMPAYTQGMVTRHQFFANTDAWKVAAVYNLKEYGVKAVVTIQNLILVQKIHIKMVQHGKLLSRVGM